MLYAAHAMQRLALEPIHLMAATGQMLLQPISQASTLRPAQASLEMLSRLTRDYRKPVFDLDVSEQVLDETPFAQLLHFTARDRVRDPQHFFLAAPLSGHHATLLRHTVDALLDHGAVTITDWRDARTIPVEAGRFGYDEFVDHLIRFFAVTAQKAERAPHAIAVCQPGPAMVAALTVMTRDSLPGRPASLSIISAPMDTAAAPTEVTRLAAARGIGWFERKVIHRVPFTEPGRGRRVYPGFLQLMGFMAMNPERHMEKQRTVFFDRMRGDDDAADRVVEFYDEYWSVLDVPAEFYLETIERIFQNRELACNTASHHGTAIDPGTVTDVALQTIEAGSDDVCAPGQTQAAHAILSGLSDDRRDHLLAEGVGHYGGFAGRRFRESILPRIATFARRHAG